MHTNVESREGALIEVSLYYAYLSKQELSLLLMRQSRPHHRHNLSHTVVRNSMCVTTYVQWLYKDLENPVTINQDYLFTNQTLYKPNSPDNLLHYSGQYIFRYKFVLTCFSGTVNMNSYQCRTITFCVRFLALPECVVYLLACGHNVQCQTFGSCLQGST